MQHNWGNFIFEQSKDERVSRLLFFLLINELVQCSAIWLKSLPFAFSVSLCLAHSACHLTCIFHVCGGACLCMLLMCIHDAKRCLFNVSLIHVSRQQDGEDEILQQLYSSEGKDGGLA